VFSNTLKTSRPGNLKSGSAGWARQNPFPCGTPRSDSERSYGWDNGGRHLIPGSQWICRSGRGSLWRGVRTKRPERYKIVLRHSNFDEFIPRTALEKRDEDFLLVIFDPGQHRARQGYEGITKNRNIGRDFKIFAAVSFDVIIGFGSRDVFKNGLPAEVLCAPVCHAMRYYRAPIKNQGYGGITFSAYDHG
jgi:hypothetical protein